MNWFASFAVLLTITQAPLPIPRQAPNGTTTSSSNADTQSKSHNAPPAPYMAVVQPPTTPEGQDADREHTKDNESHSVIVRELPTVSVSKDWADRGVWWFSLCLVMVGGAQAFYVAKTLSAIKEQAESLKRQNDMIVSKERARLRVELDRFSGVKEKDFPATIVKAEVSIFGTSLASVRDTRFFAILGDENGIEETILWWPPIHKIPEVISPNSPPITTYTILHRAVNMILGDEGIDDVLRGDKFIYAIGAIHYTDVFEGRWVFRFSRRWKYHRFADGKPFGGDWENYGEAKENGEYPDTL